MYKVALIQNQSEMLHYGYADARTLIKNFGYQLELYTADNIDNLGLALSDDKYDAIIIGSNSFNDKTIREEFEKNYFINIFQTWIQSNGGRGCLCMHQLRLASEKNSSLMFLPEYLNNVSAVKRLPGEKSADGNISFGFKAEKHNLCLYPNKINPQNIKRIALEYKSLPGIYWHYWSNVNLSDWEILINDLSTDENFRPLIINSRKPDQGRIVLSALTLDWQKQEDVLQNILTYVVEGKHSTAILSSYDNTNRSFEYFMSILRSKKTPFRNYNISDQLEILTNSILNNIHNILLLGPNISLSELPSNLSKNVKEKVNEGKLKLISIKDTDGDFSSFSVFGRERSAQELLYAAELKIQSELHTGYIDGSFWSTIETLQILNNLDRLQSSYKQFISKVLILMSKHDKNGSYDEVFGATCALLWIRGIHLGITSYKTEETFQWIKERISEYESREQLQAYLIIIELKIESAVINELVENIFKGIDFDSLSEIDIIVYLKAMIASNNTNFLLKLIFLLKDKQKENGSWIDLATTATSISVLIDILLHIQLDKLDKASIENIIYNGVNYIQNSLQSATVNVNNECYPWDGKASTTVKCINALFRYEELISLPVNELIKFITKNKNKISSISDSRQALSILNEMKDENTNLINKSNELKIKLLKKSKISRLSTTYMSISLLFGYILLSIIIVPLYNLGPEYSISLIKIVFIDAWPSHIAIMGAIGALLALPIKKWFINNDERE
ncbi:hypothetical protein GJV85_03630 [Sulfurimonas aquatica]|uniref:Uncharacterized protein n=1 Tax=Sulfurimonas aquatica TaxID=2672570 RepID=A0A975GC46_9BACT|nr:hypothetical protein [Sulfurimonas aquatica]QSZ41240.1 hypothetical protein GJV85_03630 [Sulfurimonas aquatica]